MNSAETKECPVCCNSAEFYSTSGADYSHIKCTRCGEFKIEGRTEAHFINNKDYSKTVRNNISNWIFEHQGVMLTSKDVAFLINLKPPTIQKRADKLILFFAEHFPELGKEFTFNDSTLDTLLNHIKHDYTTFKFILEEKDIQNYPHNLLALSWSQNMTEFFFLLIDYIEIQQGYIAITPTDEIQITTNGWEHIEKLKELNPKSNIAFVAMSFDPNLNFLFTNAIKPAINDSGYEDLRIDKKEHNNKIDDEIIAGIRRSKFAVCDFTGQSGNIYFEAGYVLGFGLQVIWTCRKDEIDNKKIHFDNRQYNFLTWEENKLDDFKKALHNRIEATIGKPN